MRQFLMKWAASAQRAYLAREAGPVYPIPCADCGQIFTEDLNESVYRCFDCYDANHQCKSCAITTHQKNPLHRVEAWDPRVRFWSRQSLGELGLVINLRHTNGESCPLNKSTRSMTLVHDHGVHPYEVRFCRCTDLATGEQMPEPSQLIRFGFWPASWDIPSSAFSLSALRDHHLLSLQAQISAHDYMAYLRRTTDNVCPHKVPVSH